MQTAQELLIHGLTDILDGEQKLVEALGELAEETTNPQLQKAFQSHQAQTEKQVERVRQCFEILGEEPQESECKGIAGLKQEHDEFKQEDPSEEILDVFNAGAGAKTEAYEIAAYESLIRLAEETENSKISRLLNQNLKEEQQTLKKMQGFVQKLKIQNVSSEEEEQEEEGWASEESGDSEDSSISQGRKGSKSAGASRSRRSRVA